MTTALGFLIRCTRIASNNKPWAKSWLCNRCYSSITSTPSKAAVAPARTRFAPSPTGHLHLGSLRTALFNYLYAKATGGKFILRIEDTDQKRTVRGAEDSILETLRWAKLQWDEGPEVGGPHGPYRQSERAKLHREHAHRLLKSGYAYRCFCSAERLQLLGEQRARLGVPTDYDRACVNISMEESDERAARGDTHVIRLKAPDAYPTFKDLVYGEIQMGSNLPSHNKGFYADPILLKSDGMPTYHLANVVDDHYMEITHVIRATEWLPSTPKHVYMYEAFNWKPPAFVHVGLLQNHERKKLSKRDGDVELAELIKKGYLPEALNNFVALLGWSHPRRGDVLAMQDLIQEFSVEKLTQGDTIVSFSKLDFLQKAHLRPFFIYTQAGYKSRIPTNFEDFPQPLKDAIPQFKSRFQLPNTPETDQKILKLMWLNQKNFVTTSQSMDDLDYFFIPETEIVYDTETAIDSWEAIKERLLSIYPDIEQPVSDEQVWAKAGELIGSLIIELEGLQEGQWSLENLSQILLGPKSSEAESPDSRRRFQIRMRIVRHILAAGKSGPSVPEIAEVLGRKKVMFLLKQAPIPAGSFVATGE